MADIFGPNLFQENGAFELELSFNKLHGEKKILKSILFIKFYQVGQMVHSQNCCICRSLFGKQASPNR